MAEELLTLREVAGRFKVPLATVYQWRQGADPLPGYKVGKHVRCRWSEIEEWLGRRAAR